jgi:SAM-dependent methyltransferase
MPERIDLFDSTYGHFSERVAEAVRSETFGTDIGQNSWTTIEEYDQILPWLELTPDHHVLEVASGSGGPALHLADTIGCRITGIDSNEEGVATALGLAARSGQAERARFAVADANARLPFDDGSFDGIICIDALNHLPDRVAIFREWGRVLRPGGRALFTDPVVITGGVTNDELATRSSIGLFLFVPPGLNDRFVAEAGLDLIRIEDATANAALVSGRWHGARDRHRDVLLGIEGEERFAGLQKFFAAVHRLTSERRLSRMMYLARKPVG